MKPNFIICLLALLFSHELVYQPVQAEENSSCWKLHIINNSSRGADGIRLSDINRDGSADIATGWEEGGTVMVYINPGVEKADTLWPSVVAGKAASVEDAVFADLDCDGAIDVVSCCEGEARSIFVHWAPQDLKQYLDPCAWKTEVIPASAALMQWMFCFPVQIDGRNGIDLVAGAKNETARLGWFEAPPKARSLANWKWHPISPAGWIMSIIPADMDNDSDLDIVISDRKGALRSCRWLENPGSGTDQKKAWRNHFIGGTGREVMFITLADLDNDSITDILAAVRPASLLWFRRESLSAQSWETRETEFPEATGHAKAVSVADIDLDGGLDIVVSCEHSGGKSGVFWLSARDAFSGREWEFNDISGSRGTKYDLVECIDLDGDGDLDVVTTEERENLGVIWYENPAK